MRIIGIFLTNSFDMTDSPKGPSCGMYVAIARLNHSCSPNVQQTHLPESQEEVLYASRDIQIGEEINDCYIELRKGKRARNKELLELFRFECSCVSCSLDDVSRASDDNCREKAMVLEDAMLELTSNGDPWGAFNTSKQLIDLLTNVHR